MILDKLPKVAIFNFFTKISSMCWHWNYFKTINKHLPANAFHLKIDAFAKYYTIRESRFPPEFAERNQLTPSNVKPNVPRYILHPHPQINSDSQKQVAVEVWRAQLSATNRSTSAVGSQLENQTSCDNLCECILPLSFHGREAAQRWVWSRPGWSCRSCARRRPEGCLGGRPEHCTETGGTCFCLRGDRRPAGSSPLHHRCNRKISLF